MSSTVCVPIDADIYAEFILRTGKSFDVANTIENVIQDFLDRTEGDATIWSESHAKMIHAQQEDDFEEKYGDPSGYYQWGNLKLLNGTHIKMSYEYRWYYATVRHEEIIYEERAYSPSRLASQIANGTSRNAWRDLWIKAPGSSDWDLADRLRSQPKVRALTIDELSA